MAKASIQAVRKTELRAAEIEKNSMAEKEVILQEARQRAKSILNTRIKEAQSKADKDLQDTNQQCEVLLEEAKRKAENEILQLQKKTKSSEEDAIHLVLSNLF